MTEEKSPDGNAQNERATFRAMRRFKQQLSRKDCIELLKTEKRGVLSLIDDGG